MKIFFAFLFLILSTPVFALTLEFYDACHSNPIFKTEIDPKFETVGDLTVYFLEKNHIPYQGNEQAMNSIMNSPVGMDALEVLSDTEMRSYGWCYFVDNKIPEVYPNQYNLKNVGIVQWFFSYAHYSKGEWLSQCEKANLIKSDFLCAKNSLH